MRVFRHVRTHPQASRDLGMGLRKLSPQFANERQFALIIGE